MHPTPNSIMNYARDMNRTANFYETYAGFKSSGLVDGLIELTTEDGMRIVVQQAAKSFKLGQVGVKLVFSVQDVEGFKAKSAKLGLKFGSTHTASGYSFANAKDPDKNSVSYSNRAFRKNAWPATTAEWMN